MERQKKSLFLLNTAYYLVVILMAVICLRLAARYLMPLILGFAIASFLSPLSDAVRRRVRLRRGLVCSVLTLGLFLGVFAAILAAAAGIGWLMLYLLAKLPSLFSDTILPAAALFWQNCIDFLIGLFPQYAGTIQHWNEDAASQLVNTLLGLSSYALSAGARIAAALPQIALFILFTILSTVFITTEYRPITRFLKRQIPLSALFFLRDLRGFLKTTVARMLWAYLVMFCLTFAELAAGLLLLRVKDFLLTAAIIALLDLLPLLGSAAILLPWGIYAILAGNAAFGVGLILLAAAVEVARNIAEPRILGGRIGLHPLACLGAIYVGLQTVGILGAFLAPLVLLYLIHLQENGSLHLFRA